MGRPPIGTTPMTRTEIQRRWRAKRVQQGLRRSGPEPSASDRIDPDIQPVSGEAADQQRIEELTRQLDQARRELAAAHQSIDPRAAGPDDPGRCFYCLKRQDEVKVMLKAARPRFTVFTCNECVDEMRQELSTAFRRRIGVVP
jgi:ClpX C4-type zinc finger